MSGADIQPSDKVDGLFVSGQTGPRHMTVKEYGDVRKAWEELRVKDKPLFDKAVAAQANADLDNADIRTLAGKPYNLSIDAGSAGREVLDNWRSADFSSAHQPQMMVQVNGRLASPSYVENLANRADRLDGDTMRRVMEIEDLSQLDRQTSQALRTAGIAVEELDMLAGRRGLLAKAADGLGDIGHKAGPIAGPAIAAMVGVAALASGASAGEAYEAMAETGAPFVGMVNATLDGDDARAAREGVNEITGWTGAAAGVQVGGTVAGPAGAIIGGIGGGIGGAVAGDDIADTLETRASAFENIEAQRNISSNLSDFPNIVGSWAMISPYIEDERLPFDVERSEHGIITNYSELDWTDRRAQEALQHGVRDALDAHKAALGEHGVIGEVMSWFDTNGNEQDELQLDVANLEAAWQESLSFQAGVDRQDSLQRFVENQNSIPPWVSVPDSPLQQAYFNAGMGIDTLTTDPQLDPATPNAPEDDNTVAVSTAPDIPKI